MHYDYNGDDLKSLFNSCWNATWDLSHPVSNRRKLTDEEIAFFKQAEEQIREIRNYIYQHDIDSIW